MSDIHLNRAGQSLGVFSLEDVQRGLTSGQFQDSDLGWRSGMETWKPLSEWSDLQVADESGEEPVIPRMPVPPLGGAILPAAGRVGVGVLPSWEQKEEIGWVRGFFGTVKEILLDPVATFKKLKTTGGIWTPFLFLMIGTMVATVLALAVQWGLQGVMGSLNMSQNSEVAKAFVVQGVGMGVGLVIILVLLPIILFIGSFIGAGLWHVSLMILGGATKPFEATYRVFCYAGGAVALINLVPCCGGIVAEIWRIVAGAIGLSEVHGVSTTKAVFAILLPTILCCALCIAAAIPLWQSISTNPEFMDAFNKALQSK